MSKPTGWRSCGTLPNDPAETYDYELTLTGGGSEDGRLIGGAVLLRPGDYPSGAEASVSVKAVYETADGEERGGEAPRRRSAAPSESDCSR